jgi:hypothetical protein
MGQCVNLMAAAGSPDPLSRLEMSGSRVPFRSFAVTYADAVCGEATDVHMLGGEETLVVPGPVAALTVSG